MKKILVILCSLISSTALSNLPSGFDAIPSFETNFKDNTLNLKQWGYRLPGVRNYCVNNKSSVSVNNGILKITTYSKKDANNKLINYCGMISTDGKFSQKYGYWEASIRFNSTQGVQPAFWIQSATVGADINNPQKSGVEIDVFEHLAEAKSGQFDNALHWNGYGSNHKSWAKKYDNTSINDGQFHRYALAWTPTAYIFYLDDKVISTVSADVAPISITPQYIILSTEVPRNRFPQTGFGDLKTSTSIMEVSYIKVYPYIGHQ